MFGRLEQLRLVEAPHGQTYGAGALALRKQRSPAFGAEAPSYAAVGAHPTDRTTDGQPSQRHHDTRVEGGSCRLLATMAMADTHIEWRGVGAVATGAAEASALDHRPSRFIMEERTLSPRLLSSVLNPEQPAAP